MKILILGAGQVGSSAAESLSEEAGNEVTIVDVNGAHLRELQDRLDIRTVEGYASHPRTLEQAGAADADMIVALTDTDEANMVACQIAHTLYRTPIKIARIRAAEYTSRKGLFAAAAIPVDVIISPEQLVTEHVEQLLLYPGTTQVLNFADGKVRLVGLKARAGGLLVGQELRQLRQHIPHTDARVAAIYRKSEVTDENGEDRYLTIQPGGDTVIEEDDLVFFVAARRDIRVMMSELLKLEHPVRRVIIAGGGNIGFRLAKRLENTNQVKLIERNKDRARFVAERLKRTVVLNGDCVNEDLLREENIENADVFCALTNAEESNAIASFLAKRLGAKKVIALINKPSYAQLVEGQYVDVAVSPQQITLGQLLARVRGMRADVARVHSLRGGNAEALEAVVHGDSETSRVVGRTVEEIPLPPGASIGAIVRGDQIKIAHHDTVIEAEDHVILFLTKKDQVNQVIRLFQVDPTFV